MSTAWKLFDCPNCDQLGLEEGEIREGKTLSYQWQYCENCGWQSELHRYRLVRNKDGILYYPDATFVRDDIALSLKLRGKLQLGGEIDDGVVSPLPGEYPAVARCSQCGGQTKLRCRLRQDVAALMGFWDCENCGFRIDAGRFLSPGFFEFYGNGKRIRWKEKSFLLTHNQRLFIGELYKAYLERKPDVHERELLSKVGYPSSRLRDSFRSANKKLWGTLIVHAKGAPKGTYRLNI